MQYGAECPRCKWFETDYNNSRQDVCGRCRDKEFRDSHGGVDRVTDFLFPGAKHVMPAIKAEATTPSTTTTPHNTRPHHVKRIGQQHVDDQAPMGQCVVCHTVGEWNALVDLLPNTYGCAGYDLDE